MVERALFERALFERAMSAERHGVAARCFN
jgi:hypothetical protein